MGCLKLHIESEPTLRLAYSKKGQKPSKNMGSYYPFGLQHKGYNNVVSANVNSVATRFGFGGKELNNELGLDWYDVSARNYDPALGRWMNIDPLAEQMRRHSPYNYAFNSPIRFTDSDGMAPTDVIVLSYGDNENTGSNTTHRYGHQAILIGDDENGWTLYSKDTDTTFANADQYTIETFATVEEFADSEYNTFKINYDDGKGKKSSEKDKEGKPKQRFKDGYRIKTTKEQDKKMHKAASKSVKETWYQWNNCTHVVEDALEAGGLKTGEWTPGKVISSSPKSIPIIILPTPNVTPNSKQEEIERKNKGTDVDEKLKHQ